MHEQGHEDGVAGVRRVLAGSTSSEFYRLAWPSRGDLPRSGRRTGCLEPVFDRILAELALDMAAKVLKGGGDALIKVFQGSGFQELVQEACRRFAKAKLVKPTAFRARSSEMYLLAKDFRLV
jgi:hypothetical protein